VVAYRIGDETILILTGRSDEMEHFYKLNDIGAFVWDRIDGKRTIADLAADVSCSFDAGLPQIKSDLSEFFQHLQKVGAIRILIRKNSSDSG